MAGREWDQNLQWFCIRVEAQKEIAAERILRDNGFNAFCPIEIKLRRANSYSKRREPRQYAKLIRYLFVAFEKGKPIPWFSLFRFRMIQAVIGQGGLPVAIRSIDMQRVFGMSEAVTPYRKASNPHRSFMVGENVEIVDGPFVGRFVRVEEIKGDKARIILELFGENRDVMLPLEYLEVA